MSQGEPDVWHPMKAGDLQSVSLLSDKIYPPEYREQASVFEEKLSLFPAGCFCAVVERRLVGYCLAYPWKDRNVPPLNQPLETIPAHASTYFIHDLALSSDTREKGLGAAAVTLQFAVARAQSIDRTSLVAVLHSQRFWRRSGFEVVHDEMVQESVRKRYGPDAHYMERIL